MEKVRSTTRKKDSLMSFSFYVWLACIPLSLLSMTIAVHKVQGFWTYRDVFYIVGYSLIPFANTAIVVILLIAFCFITLNNLFESLRYPRELRARISRFMDTRI